MADHYRAAADMIVRWALSASIHCSVEIDDAIQIGLFGHFCMPITA